MMAKVKTAFTNGRANEAKEILKRFPVPSRDCELDGFRRMA